MYYHEDSERVDCQDGEDDPYCPICEASLLWEDCDECGGDGYYYDECCGWCDVGETVVCDQCRGFGGWYRCTDTHGGKRLWMPDELPKG